MLKLFCLCRDKKTGTYWMKLNNWNKNNVNTFSLSLKFLVEVSKDNSYVTKAMFMPETVQGS